MSRRRKFIVRISKRRKHRKVIVVKTMFTDDFSENDHDALREDSFHNAIAPGLDLLFCVCSMN